MAQDNPIRFKVEGQAIYNSEGQVPFWFRSNQFGSIPLDGASGSLIGTVNRVYDSDRSKLFDWGFGIEGRANLGNEAQATLIEGYAKLRLGMIQFKAGRSKDIMGIVGDSLLSSGSFSISGNALGVPQVSVSIPEFYTIPVFNGLFAVKGNFSHGWLGTLPLDLSYGVSESRTYFHQKSLYARVGVPEGRFKFYAGFNHQVFWGNYSNTHQGNPPLSTWEEFVKVTLGQVHVQSKVGNHLGSLDLALEYTFPAFRVKAYRQALYDIGALSKLANIQDGLQGVSLTNRRSNNGLFNWNRILLEVFYTKNQAGELSSPKTRSGAENYYNNYQYTQGWSYMGQNLGNPFIIDRTYARQNLVAHPENYYINNRLILINAGFEGSIKDVVVRTKLSFSRNYGTHRTSGRAYRSPNNIIRPDPDYIFRPVNQFSFYLEGRKPFRNNVVAGLTLAGDRGGLLYNSAGIIASVSKSF